MMHKTTHKGQQLAQFLYQNYYSFATIAKRLAISQKNLYEHLNNPCLSDHVIQQLAQSLSLDCHHLYTHDHLPSPLVFAKVLPPKQRYRALQKQYTKVLQQHQQLLQQLPLLAQNPMIKKFWPQVQAILSKVTPSPQPLIPPVEYT